MKKRFTRFLIVAFLTLPILCFSQGEWNNWYFGVDAAMTFNFGDPVALHGSAMLQNASVTSVSVSDSAGNLLFYSNGWYGVWNKNNAVMPNGTGLVGGLGPCTQNVLSVPKIGDLNKYYLFTVGSILSPLVGLHYSVIDMTLQGGLGDIVTGMKNIPIPSGDSAVDAITAVRHKNNKDVWVVVRKRGPNTKYLSYLITSSGISSSPVVSPTNLPKDFARGGDLKISQDGTKLVCSDTLTEICDFNALTGVVTPKFMIKAPLAFGAEFSVDSRYLYLCTIGSTFLQNNAIGWQFDLSYKDSLSFVQHQVLLGDGFAFKLQLAPNWKIYAGANPVVDSLHCINNPSFPGLACNYQKNAVSLAGNDNNASLPQFLQRYKAYVHLTGICYPDSTWFTSDIWPPPDSIHWDFGDPASGSADYSNLPNPSHKYSNIGTYTIELFVKHIDNRTDTSWKTITIYPTPQPNLGPDQTICTGDSVTFDAGFCMGCNYLWKGVGSGIIVGTSQTFKTSQSGIYAVTVINAWGCSGHDTVQLTTTPVPTVTNNPLSKTICSGESTNIPLTSNEPGTNFHWTAALTSGNITGFSADSGIVINQILINSLSTPGIVTYHITPKVGSCVGTTVGFPVTVNAGDSVKVSITASTNNVCSGTPVTFTATPTNGGASPSYQWKVNGINVGLSSPSYTYNPVSGDLVSCVMTSSLTSCITNNPATSNQVIMVIISNSVVGVTITATQNPVCAGIPVNFTATPTNGGNSPSYQWKVNGINVGISIPSYSYTPNNGDIVECILTSNITCPSGNPATSNQVIMVINSNLVVGVSISASANPFCQGSSVTFTATPVNGGTNPVYLWKVNGIIVGLNSPTYSYIPLNGDLVSCVMTSSIPCPIANPVTSNVLLMTMNNNLPVGISISASTNPFCPGNSITFTATPVNGGINPAYQWKVNGANAGSNSPTYTYNPASGDLVSCIMTSNLVCVTGNPATSNTIIMSGTLASVVTFTSCFDTITTTNAQPFKLKGGIPLGGIYSGPGVSNGIFHPAIAGVGNHQINYTYTNAALCAVTVHRSLITINPVPFTCGNPVTDIRDNKVYQTVHIGSQCWMAENLNYGTEVTSNLDQRDNCISEKYHNPASSIQHPASVYQWDELMQYDETVSNQGLCPPGWHVPSESDWNTLFANYINNGFAASPLKYSGFSGFNALLSGTRHMNKTWDYQGFATFFWSSTAHGTTKAWAHGMNDADPSVSVYPAYRSNAFSVRCLHD